MSRQPMKVLVTGATGFVGRHLVAALLAEGIEVRAVARRLEQAQEMPWFGRVEFIVADVHASVLQVDALVEGVDAVAHLAWPGLPNYQALFHFERNLPADYAFLKRVVEAGVRQLMVTGTCFEYGLQNGQLREQGPAQPNTAYGLAKHTLRLFLESLQRERSFTLQWARLFYLYGPGQASNSLLASLDRAIDAGDEQFNMSAGEQLRDYLAIEEAAALLVSVLKQQAFCGVVNCCSGQPVSVRAMVEQRVRQRHSAITLNLGHFPYSSHEPMAFWGSTERLRNLTGERHDA